MALATDLVSIGTDYRSLLRRLLACEGTNGDPVLSMYLNLDPRDFATAGARASATTSLLDEALRAAPDGRWRGVIDQLRELLGGTAVDLDGTHALAIFCTVDGSLLDVLRLPRPVPSAVAFDHAPHVRPLIESLPRTSVCCVLVNRRSARILVGSRDELHEVTRIDDEVAGQHDQGGWSQANYQRSIEKDVDDHLRNVAAVVARHVRQLGPDQLFCAAPVELRSRFQGELPGDVRSSVDGWLEVDVENSTDHQVHEVVASSLEQLELTFQREQLDRLRALHGIAGKAAFGLDAVLAAANEHRIDTLLIAEGFGAPGMRCPRCGLLSVVDATCPIDGVETVPCADVVEECVDRAVLQAARIVNVGRAGAGVLATHGRSAARDEDATDRPEYLELQGHGSIAAVLRYGGIDGDEIPTGQRS